MKCFMVRTAVSVCLCISVGVLQAQSFEKANDYMSYIVRLQTQLSAKYLGYMSAATHGKRMKLVEKRRAEVLNSIYETRVKVSDMPTFNGDKSLRDSAVSQLKLMYSVFSEDYGKIVDMEEIAEQSYDLMEAYLMARKKANEKLQGSTAQYLVVQKDFAVRNHINLVDEKTELEQKLEQAEKISDYYDRVYLIFFKANRQEAYLLEALRAKNTNGIEQNRNALIRCSAEGLEKLKELKGFDGDRSIESVCKRALEFYREEADKKVAVLSDFIISSENFEQVKKAFESSSEKSREQVNNYNRAVNDINKDMAKYNAVNQQLNTDRSSLVDNYNSSVNAFMDVHMPYAR